MKKQEIRKYCTASGLTAMISLSILLAGTAQAMQPVASAEGETSIQIQKEVIQVSGRLGLGYLDGESVELVYDTDTGRKISELDWKLDNVYMLNAGVTIKPKSWIAFNGDIWVKVNDGDGEMDDYDWLVEGYDYTHWSHHDDTDLTEGYMFDINTAFTFYEHRQTQFTAIIGYKRDCWEWEARGGDYVYSTYYLYDTVGSFEDGELGITYSQWWDVPYLGLGFNSTLSNNFHFTGRVIISPYAMAGDEDTHHMRDLYFEEDFDPTWMYAIDLGCAYDFTQHLSLLANFHYQHYNEAEGDTTVTDLTTGAQYYYSGDAAGAEHKSSLFSLALQYNF